MKNSFIILCILLAGKVLSQTYAIGHMSINFKDPSRTGGYSISGGIQMPGTGRDIGTEVYYPASSTGSNVTLANGQFPVVVFGHGFVMTYDNYDNIYNELASKGYIVALPRTEGGFSPNHLDFGKDLSFVANEVLNLNSAATPSIVTYFNSKVQQKSALGGHSMGGGCSFIGAQNNNTLTCLFNMAAATSNTSGISSVAGASLISIPSLLISGQKDCVADTIMQNNHYTPLTSAQKFHVILKDLTHCDFGNGTSFNCTFGQTSSGCSNTVNNGIAFSRYMNYLLPFLNSQLKNNCSEGQRFMDSIVSNSTTRTARKITGSIACANVGIKNNDIQKLNTVVYPNPFKNNLSLSFTNCTKDTWIAIISPLGELIMQQKVTSSNLMLDMSNYSNGIYYLTIKNGVGQDVIKVIKE